MKLRSRLLLLTVLLVATTSIAAVPSRPYRWATITDDHGGVMIIKPLSVNSTNALLKLQRAKYPMWVGGKIVKDYTYWGFRFKDIRTAEITAEAFQAWLEYIKANKTYWLRLGTAYVSVSPEGVKLYR